TLAPLVANISYFDTMSGRGDFHNARIASGIDVSVSGNVATVTVTLPKPIVDLTLRVPTAWAFKSSTVGVQASSGAVILLNTVPASTVTLKFQTSGTVTATTNPAPGAPTTTSTISMATPTIPVATPAPASPLVVDDFSDPSRYSSEQNALGFYTGDDGTAASRITVQADWILLNFNTNTYWYSNLGPANTCNDYSSFTKLSLAIRYPTTTRIGFSVVLQDTEATTCTGLTQHSFDVTAMINSATAGSDGWLHLDILLTNFVGVDLTRLRAVSLASFASAGQVEVDYIYFS
ncbi:hypothetical protein BGX20_004734, partial [Mortierella sp. AD010]